MRRRRCSGLGRTCLLRNAVLGVPCILTRRKVSAVQASSSSTLDRQPRNQVLFTDQPRAAKKDNFSPAESAPTIRAGRGASLVSTYLTPHCSSSPNSWP